VNAERPCRRFVVAAALLAATTTACEKHEYERPSREERVAEAAALLTPETFDTIRWASDSARAFDGNNAYAAKCRDCHGYMGAGDTEYARRQGITVPSLIRPDWPGGSDVVTLRERIFIGHPGGMPTFGVAGITPREIDAVAYYIAEVLRPEVLGR
jgi:mono/diheme cytochrome c family protein